MTAVPPIVVPDDPLTRYAGAIVLCGGTSQRMGVADKTALPFENGTVLDAALDGLPTGPVVCVGEERPLLRPDVLWARERPAGGGPVAGLRAGLDALGNHAGPDEDDLVAVLAGDQPFGGRVAAHLVRTLAAQVGAVPDSDPDTLPDAVAAPAPGDGRPALLLAAYRFGPLTSSIGDEPTGQGVYRTLRGLRVTVAELPATMGLDPAVLALDVDTPSDLDHARGQARQARAHRD